jgi:proton-translocating NADH-quinone oxidoreductase chain M
MNFFSNIIHIFEHLSYSIDLLLLILIILMGSIILLIFIPNTFITLIKQIGLAISCLIFALTLILWILYNNEIGNFVFLKHISWLKVFNIYYIIGIDGISLFFVILTALLIPICILISWNSIIYKMKEFIIMLLLTEFLLINVFIVLDLFFFYIFFEGVLIPMFIIIGVWGSRQRKIHAAYQFFFYTLLGSILMLLGIIIIYFHAGTTDIQILFDLKLSPNKQLILWLAFFSSFAVKIPMLPVHIWLPEAHVEAPTAGSVILAGVLLKLGTYGIIRFMIPLFPYAMIYFTPLVFTMCVIGIIYSSLTTIRQIDLKKIIAYSSVAHMNFALLGLFTNNVQGIEGCLFFMLGHGVVSSGLFLCIGILYDRYHTRNILYYGGLVQVMPIFSLFFLIFTLANIGFPGMVNFVGEFLVLIGTWKVNTVVIFFAATGLIFGAVYAIWFYNRLVFGQIRFYSLQQFIDLTRREFFLLLPLIFLIFFMGIYPVIFLNTFNMSVNNYINLI